MFGNVIVLKVRMNKIPKDFVRNEKIGKIEKCPKIVPHRRKRVQFRIYFELKNLKSLFINTAIDINDLQSTLWLMKKSRDEDYDANFNK